MKMGFSVCLIYVELRSYRTELLWLDGIGVKEDSGDVFII